MKDSSTDVRRLLRYIVTFQKKFLNNDEVETWIKLLFSSSSLFLVPSPRSERLERAIYTIPLTVQRNKLLQRKSKGTLADVENFPYGNKVSLVDQGCRPIFTK